MADLRHALAEFGHDIGIPNLAPGPQGELQLRFPGTGALLGVSTHEGWAVVHYAEPVRYDAAALVLLDREEGGRQAIEERGIPVYPLYTRTSLLGR